MKKIFIYFLCPSIICLFPYQQINGQNSYFDSLKSKIESGITSIDNTKNNTISAIKQNADSFLAEKRKERIRFENIYDKPFWENDAIFFTTLSLATAGAAAFTVLTAGTGAPAAGVGVSYVASQLIAGGGAGSYMAGLSTVGGWFGGNALTGAAILNAGSASIFGLGAKTVPVTVAKTLGLKSTAIFGGLKAAETVKELSGTSALIIETARKFGDYGFQYLSIQESDNTQLVMQIFPSGEIGTGKVEDLLRLLKNANVLLTNTLKSDEEIRDKLKKLLTDSSSIISEKYKDSIFNTDKEEMLKNIEKIKELNDKIVTEKINIEMDHFQNEYKSVENNANILITNYLANKKSASKEIREDAIMGSVLLYNLGNKSDFSKYIKQFEADKKESFLLYLKAIAYIIDKDFDKAKAYAIEAMDSEPEAIEPILALMMALAELNRTQQVFELEIPLKEKFDSSHYKTQNSLVTAYNLFGDIANSKQLPQTAAKFHKKSFDEMGVFDSNDKKALICLKIANDYHLFGSKLESTKYYEKARNYVSDDELKQRINLFYENKIKTQKMLN